MLHKKSKDSSAKSLNPRGYDIGLYDSATGKNLRTKKVVDVTKDCPRTEKDVKVRFLFTRAKRGRIVMIVRTYPGEDYGSSIHFFVDELDREMRIAPRDDTFGSTAVRLGLCKSNLRLLIEKNVPVL